MVNHDIESLGNQDKVVNQFGVLVYGNDINVMAASSDFDDFTNNGRLKDLVRPG